MVFQIGADEQVDNTIEVVNIDSVVVLVLTFVNVKRNPHLFGKCFMDDHHAASLCDQTGRVLKQFSLFGFVQQVFLYYRAVVVLQPAVDFYLDLPFEEHGVIKAHRRQYRPTKLLDLFPFQAATA